jgi:Udp N-acetylglucosamine O-acyltransferase
MVGLRRAGFSAQDQGEIKTVFKLVYMNGLNIAQAPEKAATIKFGAAARAVGCSQGWTYWWGIFSTLSTFPLELK